MACCRTTACGSGVWSGLSSNSTTKVGDSLTAKEYLRRFLSLTIRIQHKKAELAELRATAVSVGGTDYSNDRVQISYSGAAPFESKVEKLIELQTDLSSEVVDYEMQKSKIINEIHDVKDDNFVQLLYLRYVEGLHWDAVAVRMKYSSAHIRKLHGQALSDFAKCHPEIASL